MKKKLQLTPQKYKRSLKLKINTVYNSIKIMKPWINLTKDVKLYTENCKTLQREIKEILNKWGETLMG